jgi:hypothetical protein
MKEEADTMPKIIEAPFMDLRERAWKADALYEKLREQLEREHLKEIIAIEPDSGDYFIGKDRRDAEKKARAKHPDKLFFRRRIGPNPAVIHLPGRARPTGIL